MAPEVRKVGKQLHAEAPAQYPKLLATAVALQSEPDPELSPLKPKNSKSPVWEHFAFYDGRPQFVYCRLCCPPGTAEANWELAGMLRRNASGSTKMMLAHEVAS